MPKLYGKCIEVVNNKATFILSEGQAEKDKLYTFKDFSKGTLAQNDTFHDLIEMLFKYMHETDTWHVEFGDKIKNFSCTTEKELKGIFKRDYGRGFYEIKYVDNNNGMKDCPSWEDVPSYAKEDFRAGNRGRVEGKLYSWSDYNMEQRRNTIAHLLLIMDKIGVSYQKYYDMRDHFDKKTQKYFQDIAKKFGGEII